MQPFHRYGRNVRIAAACLCLPLAAAAADTIEEIVVTADFRARPADELAVSVTVLDAAEIGQKAVQHFEELIATIPNLNWSGDGNRARYLQIRGIGELEQYEGAPNPSIGFLIDDIDFSGIGTVGTLFDIDRVEVLRGPQGTRYGANALAGLVYLTSTDPADDFGGRLELTAAGDGTTAGGLALGGPVGGAESLAWRLSAHRYRGDGFRDNPYLGRRDTNGRDETTLRGKLAWTAGDAWSFRLNGMWIDVDDGYDAFAIDNSLTTLSDRPGRDAQRSRGTALRADWHGDGSVRFTSLSSYADTDIDFSFDADWGNPDAWAPYTYDFVSASDRARRTWSQELRVSGASTPDGGIDWLLGLYVQRLDERLQSANQGTYVDPPGNFDFELDTRLASRYAATSLALFGQAGIAVGTAGEVGIGVRVERRDTDYSDSGGLALGPGETMAGGELSYTHELSDRSSAWGTLAAGYKAGGFNLGPVPEGRREFGQERLWNAEAGIRTASSDGQLRASLAAFYSLRRDQQVRSSFQQVPNDPSSFVFFTDNAARGRNLGVEADLGWSPDERWDLYATLGLLEATFGEYAGAGASLEGRDQAHAPRYTAALGAAWRHPGGLFARVDVSARGRYYFDVSHDQKADAATLVNARLGWESGRLTVQLWARNLFDEVYAVRGFYFGNEPPDFPERLYIRRGDPRQAGLTIDARF